MKQLITLFLLNILVISLNAQQLSKVYILSEGGFSAGTSALSLYNNQSNTFTQNIFSPGNLGLYPDGLVYYEGNLYLTEQGSFGGSGKIYKLDTLGTVISSATIESNPYSLAIANNKIYITIGPSSRVTVLNLSDFSFIKNITVGAYPQEILAYNNKVFVANTSVWGGDSDSTVSVIDPSVDLVVATITVKKDPASLAISNDGHLLIGCPGDDVEGKIFKVDASTYQIVKSYSISQYGFNKDISVEKESDNIFFISSLNDIVKYNLTSGNASVVLSSVYPNNFYTGYAYDYSTKKHFVLDAKNFAVNGSLTILDSAYSVLGTYQLSIAPRRILFKYNSQPSSINENFTVSSFTLNQNYPNPFNPSTKVSWQMPVSGHTSLKIYDILGNEIATLVDDFMQAGNYSVDFNAGSLSSGVYIYTLRITNDNQNFISSKKMTLLK